MKKIIYLIVIFINITQNLAQNRLQEPKNSIYNDVERVSPKNNTQKASLTIGNNSELKKLREEITRLRKDRATNREQIREKDRQLQQEKEKTKKQSIKITQIEKEKKELSDIVDSLKNKIDELEDKFWLQMEELSVKLEEAFIVIKTLHEENAYLHDVINKQDNMMRNDFINTAERTLTIGNAKYKFDNFQFIISGFKPNSADIPQMSDEQKDFLTRLMYQINKAGIKVKITGTCKYDDMDKGVAKKLAYGRASNFRYYLINNFDFKDAVVSDDIEGKIRCKSCNSVIITFQ